MLDGDRSFSVRAQRQTRDTEGRGLFLQAPRIGQNDGGSSHQAEHLQIALRREHQQAGWVDELRRSQLVDLAARARVHRENQWQLHRHVTQHGQQGTQRVRIVHI